MTDDQIASLDAIGFTWVIRKGFDPISALTQVPESNDDLQESTHENSERKRGKPTSFNDRVEQLKAYKAQHGHLKVKRREDASLGSFCHNIRNARNGKNKMAITSDHIAALDAIGFDWNPPKGRQARDTSAWELYKAEREAKSGSNESRVSAQPMMVAQVPKGEVKIAKISRSSLHQAKAVATFQDRVNELSAYKARLGHFYVMRTEDRALHEFCLQVRRGKKQGELTDDQIASLMMICKNQLTRIQIAREESPQALTIVSSN